MAKGKSKVTFKHQPELKDTPKIVVFVDILQFLGNLTLNGKLSVEWGGIEIFGDSCTSWWDLYLVSVIRAPAAVAPVVSVQNSCNSILRELPFRLSAPLFNTTLPAISSF